MFTVQADVYTAKLQNNNKRKQQGVIYQIDKIKNDHMLQAGSETMLGK